MEVAQQNRTDVVSPFLKVSTYQGQTLISPKELIVRKVYSNQEISDKGIAGDDESSFTLLNFRALGTSPSAMLSARVELCVPLWLKSPANTTTGAPGANWDTDVGTDETRGHRITAGPRRDGLLKAMSSISAVYNNTSSFTTRPDESLAIAAQMWQDNSDVFGYM